MRGEPSCADSQRTEHEAPQPADRPVAVGDRHAHGVRREGKFTYGYESRSILASIAEPLMSFGREAKRRAKAAIAPLVFLTLASYFGWNAVQGNRGLVAYAQRQELLAQANADQAKAQTERDAWERRVAGLRSRHIDAD